MSAGVPSTVPILIKSPMVKVPEALVIVTALLPAANPAVWFTVAVPPEPTRVPSTISGSPPCAASAANVNCAWSLLYTPIIFYSML